MTTLDQRLTKLPDVPEAARAKAVADAARIVRPLVASFGSVEPLSAPNAIVVTDYADNVARIEALDGPLNAVVVRARVQVQDDMARLIAELDQRRPQVLIEAAIAEIPPGTPRDKVRARLGEPDQSFPDSWAYMAGPTLFGGEYTAVLVRFDAEGKVRDARKVSSKTWN